MVAHSCVPENRADRNNTQCHCPPSCTKVEYDATISTSHLSELLVDSLVANDETTGNFRDRFVRARKIRAWIDDGQDSAADIVMQMRWLLGQIRNLRTSVQFNLVNDSTSIIHQLMRNSFAIVQRTTDEVWKFRRRVTDLVTASDGCVTKLVHKVRNFSDYAKGIDEKIKEISSLDGSNVQPFDESFVRYVVRVFHEFMTTEFHEERSMSS